MIDKSAYMLRISQAGPVQLVVINFELILEFLQAAKSAEDSDSFITHIQKAKNGLEQLIQSLDFEVSVSGDFYDIYNYTYKLLCDIHFTQDKGKADAVVSEVIELMEMLLKGWRETASKVTDEQPLGEAPRVYAGLTYGRDGQAEEYIDDNEGRSFMA